MNFFNSQAWNFALYNGLAVAALIVFLLYMSFLITKLRDKKFGFSFDFAVGIIIATASRLIERVYYGTLRALQLQSGESGAILSPEWIISITATIGIVGFLWHVKTISSIKYGTKILKIAIFITLGAVAASFFWAVVF